MTDDRLSLIIPFPHSGGQVRRPSRALPLALSGLVLLLSFFQNPEEARSRSWHRSYSGAAEGRPSSCPSPAKLSFPKDFAGEHYSPEENLEAIDVAMIDQARETIDIAMYAFTDRPIADALVRAAKRGVRIRIYRDRLQVRDRGDKTRRLLSSRAGREHITVLVKHNSFRNIMHLKAYVLDHRWLRTGSANWSPPGEGAYCRRHTRSRWNQQDNNLFITRDSREIGLFEKTFDRIFARGGDRRGNRPWTPASGQHRRRRD
jgi:hypothetical protein